MTLSQKHRDRERQGDKETRRQGDKAIFLSLSPLLLVPLSSSVSLWLQLLAFLGLALCANLIQSGCHKTSETPTDIVIEHKIAPDPPRTGSATITLKLADSAGKPISGARINLEGNMSHPGMRPVFSEAREAEPGRYEAALEFTMRGDWFILFHITLPDGRKLEKQIDVKGVQSG
jgi:YtkA-like